MNKNTDIYNVSKYTNNELYSILDLNNPTDRELEAKIHIFINKYENIQTVDGRKLYKFFNDIYEKLFDLTEDEINPLTDLQEGFAMQDPNDTTNTILDATSFTINTETDIDSDLYKSIIPSKIVNDATPNTNKAGTINGQQFSSSLNTIANQNQDKYQTYNPNYKSNETYKLEKNIGYTPVTTLSYTPGQLNPILKETIKRIISIDSQYRDQSAYPLSTNYTFNLSDTLNQVVSLKLYSIQLPYTWYTINNNFGSNFFYIKGNSPGIDDGNSDYRIIIPPGTYTAIELIGKINNAITSGSIINGTTIPSLYNRNDVSFNNTDISINNNNSKCTLNINLNKYYNDINYELYFPNQTSPGDNYYNFNNTLISNPKSRFNSIPGFLGFPNSTYTSYNIYSNSFSSIPLNNSFTVTSSNNSFNVVLYTSSINPYLTDASYQTIPITITASNSYTTDTLISQINTQFSNNVYLKGSTIELDSYTVETPTGDLSGSTPNYTNIYTPIKTYRYKMNIVLDKINNRYNANMKAIVIFPNDTNIWISSTSCFNFKQPNNELNEIISEVDAPVTTRNIINNPYIYLKCNAPYYGNYGISHYDSGTITYDNSFNPTAQYPESHYTHIDTISQTDISNITNINPIYGPYYISKGTYILSGDEYTIENKITDISNGNFYIDGSTNYNILSSNYDISGTIITNSPIHIISSSTQQINSTNPYLISPNTNSPYQISNGPNLIEISGPILTSNTQNQIAIQSNTLIDISGSNYDIFGNTYINGNININSSTTTPTQIQSPRNIQINCSNYTISGLNIIVNGLIEIDTRQIVTQLPTYQCISNPINITGTSYKIYGNTNVSGNLILTGNVHIKNVTNTLTISGDDYTSNYDNLTPYDSNSILKENNQTIITTAIFTTNNNSLITITGNNYIISSESSYTIIGQDISSIIITGNSTISSGNVSITSPDNSYNISSPAFIIPTGTVINGTSTINGNSTVNANIQITSSNPYTIISQTAILLGNTKNITGQIEISGNVILSGQELHINTQNTQNTLYSISGTAHLQGNVQITHGNSIINNSYPYNISGTQLKIIGNTHVTGNVNIEHGNVFVTSNNNLIISGNNYNISGTNHTLTGISYIVTGNSIVRGNNYSVYGNVNIYQNHNLNDYRIDISNSTIYLLDSYLNAINNSMQKFTVNQTTLQRYPFGTISLNIDTGYSNMNFNINNKLDLSNYDIDLSQCILFQTLGFPQILTTQITTVNFEVQGGGYKIDASNNQFRIKYKSSSFGKNQYIPDIIITIPPDNYKTTDSFATAINGAFTNSAILYNVNLQNTNILFISNSDNTLTCNFTINITSVLTQDNYSVYFYDTDLITNRVQEVSGGFYNYIGSQNWSNGTNSWFNYLNLANQMYDLSSQPHVIDTTTRQISSVIKGTQIIQSNKIILTNETNYFYIRPVYNSLGGVWTNTINPNGDGIERFNDIKITIPLINNTTTEYSKEALLVAINTIFTDFSILNGSNISYITDIFNRQYTKIQLNVNKIFTTQDFILDFYDPVSFVTCNIGVSGSSSVRNVTWDATLGWILGFRNLTIYELTPANQYTTSTSNTYINYPGTNDETNYTSTPYSYTTSTNIVHIGGDTVVSVYLYNYFMILLDDYVQNHLNDGLVTITNTDTTLPLPSYANRATFKCNPKTKTLTSTTVSSTGKQLTANQLYAANEILNIKQTQKSQYSLGPTVQDIFGIIPIKTGNTFGQPYIEFGGSLQLQERTYFGPVNIHRMSIKLINDKGDIVDLNGSNWSFSLICEQLYTPALPKS